MKRNGVFCVQMKFAGVVVLLFAFCLAGCASTSAGSSAGTTTLAGVWIPEEGQDISDNFIEERLELSKDGTGTFEGFTGLTWTAENSRLKLTFTEMELELEYNYKLSGSILILTRDNGRSVRYIKE